MLRILYVISFNWITLLLKMVCNWFVHICFWSCETVYTKVIEPISLGHTWSQGGDICVNDSSDPLDFSEMARINQREILRVTYWKNGWLCLWFVKYLADLRMLGHLVWYCSLSKLIGESVFKVLYWWFSARLQYLHCYRTGDTAVLY